MPEVRMEVENLNVFYGSQSALRDVSLGVQRGSVTAIVGPSGCGKSTFLQTLNRLTDLLPGCRVTGSIRLDGEDIYRSGCDLLQLRRNVGMIFQKPSPFPVSIARNFFLPLREHGVRDRQEMQAKMEKSLRDVGLWEEVRDRLKAPARSLSGGQQQRLCIARALALGPEVILFDEPCSALDPIAAGRVEDLIHTLRSDYTAIVVTHNLAQARRLADETALFWVVDGAGTLIEKAQTERFFSDPEQTLTRDYVTGLRG